MAIPDTPSNCVSVVIIGAGFSGLVVACQLKQQLNCDDFVIYDRAATLGGTWAVNTYPGCGVDIPAPFYSLSFAPNAEFSRFFPKQREVLQYLESVASRYNISGHVVENTEWVGASFQDSKKTWLVKLRDVKSGQEFIQESKILVSAVGGLTNPNSFHIDGIERFQGGMIHTARWDHSVSLTDKDVVVIGNGSSATQLVPAIAPNVHSVTQFIRSPQHYFPGNDITIPSSWRKGFRRLPALLRFVRLLIFLYLETSLLQFGLSKTGERMRGKAREKSCRYIEQYAPVRSIAEEYWDLLMPTADIGCKRRIFDHDGYISCLNRDNVHLTNDPIVALKEHSVLTQSGITYPADVIVLANGFSLTQFSAELRGRHGHSRKGHWKEFGYIEAYNSVAMSGFPNFFYMMGPNSGRGHTSIIYSLESYAYLTIRVIKPVISGHALTVEPKVSSERAYNDQLHTALEKTVLTNACRSWYIDEKTGRNWVIYPWSSFYMWYTTHVAGLGDWIYEVSTPIPANM
ncbi:TrkA [Aspergillus parasiticus SU-1]|uniref:TrkA n=1 Tax=Aspergillus parasiticus (strain ATCC 56775 / NRRL 5862 / SRRC 143 / SU-1) TaxID=1403190 RepID=A0A0F0I5J0_ASPPU|nr:TrkA [Aspergillus parasiticus SU-1]